MTSASLSPSPLLWVPAQPCRMVLICVPDQACRSLRDSVSASFHSNLHPLLWAGMLRFSLAQLSVVVQLLSCVRPFATSWTAAHQASLSFTISQSLLKLVSIESVMSSNHLILCRPPSPAFNLSRHQGIFQWFCSLHQMAKVLQLQLQLSINFPIFLCLCPLCFLQNAFLDLQLQAYLFTACFLLTWPPSPPSPPGTKLQEGWKQGCPVPPLSQHPTQGARHTLSLRWWMTESLATFISQCSNSTVQGNHSWN